MSKYLKMVFFYISIIVIVVLAVTFFNPVQREIKTITYSELINHLEHKEVKEIYEFYIGGDSVSTSPCGLVPTLDK